MSAKVFAAQMKSAIEEIKSKGTAAIYCDNLISYLDEVMNSDEPEPSAVEIERYRANLQNWVESNKHQHEQRLELFRSVITSGQSAIKSSFLLNGGASVALLAFIGHIAQFDKTKIAIFAHSLVPFALGVLAIAVTSGFTYISQWLYASQYSWARKTGFVMNIKCIVLGLSSYGFFTWGLYITYQAFINYV